MMTGRVYVAVRALPVVYVNVTLYAKYRKTRPKANPDPESEFSGEK